MKKASAWFQVYSLALIACAGACKADQAGEAHRRDQERTLRPRGLEVERGRDERTAWQALGAEVEALLGRAQ
jgi:hypothetical protein